MDDDPIPAISSEDIADDPMADYNPGILRRPELLRPTYVPDMTRIVGRTEEIDKLEAVMQPACHGNPPGDAVIVSKPGSGKTLCAKSVAGRMRAIAEKTEYKVVTAYVNCGEHSTETQVVQSLAETANKQLDVDVTVPMTGVSTSRYYKILWALLGEASAAVVILDEVDRLGADANEIIKKLADAESDQRSCVTGTILISNKTGFYTDLDPRVQSRIQNNDTEIIFGPYDANELRQILNNRLDAFVDGALAGGVVPLCAALAAQEHGDARKALDMLLSAGEHAQRNDAEQVTEEDIHAVHAEAVSSRERELIAKSLDHAQMVLLALAIYTVVEDSTEFRTSDIYRLYEEICEVCDQDPQTHNSALNHAKKWAEVELAENEYTGAGKGSGSYRKHRLLVDPEMVIESVIQHNPETEQVLLSFDIDVDVGGWEDDLG